MADPEYRCGVINYETISEAKPRELCRDSLQKKRLRFEHKLLQV